MLTLRIGYRKSIKLLKSAERKIKSLQERLDYAHQERFGDRRQKIQSKAKTSDSDRRKEKDDYDGTDDTLRTDSVGHVPSQELKEPSGKDRDLSNRPDGYKTMGGSRRSDRASFRFDKVSRSHH